MLEFPAGKCPASQARVKTWRVLPQTRPSPARCFCPSARLWSENFTDELEFESKAGRKEPPASKELWVGSCRIGLGKRRALPEIVGFHPHHCQPLLLLPMPTRSPSHPCNWQSQYWNPSWRHGWHGLRLRSSKLGRKSEVRSKLVTCFDCHVFPLRTILKSPG